MGGQLGILLNAAVKFYFLLSSYYNLITSDKIVTLHTKCCNIMIEDTLELVDYYELRSPNSLLLLTVAIIVFLVAVNTITVLVVISHHLVKVLHPRPPVP